MRIRCRESTAQISPDPHNASGRPDIYGSYVVWEANLVGVDNATREVFLYNIQDEELIQLTTNTYMDHCAKISDSLVVWVATDSWDVMTYDLETKETTRIVDGFAHWVDVSRRNIVWGTWGNQKEIKFYDGESITQLTDDDFPDYYPTISGDTVVWNRSDGSD